MSLMLNTERILLPRWRLFHTAENFDELNHVSVKSSVKEEQIDHLNAIEEWQANNNLENAIELCASAIVNGCFSDAKEAALFVLDTRPRSQSVIAMAEKVLNPNREVPKVMLDDTWAHIANLRKKTHRSPANAVLWTDIAFLYSTLGQNEKAERSIKIALILAPHNRFVVRCAARFFAHVDKISKARHAVENYQFLKHDPWVLSVELSLSYQQKKYSKHLKLSKNVIERNKILPFHSSELASTLGITEIRDGVNKKAKKLFLHSLLEPTDNSIAQAHWTENRHKLGIPLGDDIADHEAKHYKFYKSGEWENAMMSAEEWAKHEPYSAHSFESTSHISLVCQDDPVNCVVQSDRGLKLHPGNFIFLNNAAVAYAQQGKINEAEKKLKLIKKENLKEDEKPVYTATKGLLAFRKKDVHEGTELYERAINLLSGGKYKDKEGENLARIFYAREKIIAEVDGSHEFFRKVQNKMKSEESKDIAAFIEHTEKILDRQKP